MPIDTSALAQSLRRLTDRRDQATGLTSALQDVADACVELFGVTGSGIMIADDQNISRYVAATDGPGRILETLESEYGEGPCTEAFVTGETVASADLAAEEKWPDLAAAVLPHGVRAVLGAPVKLGAITVGTIDVYRDEPHVWDANERAAISRYSELIETLITAALSAHQAQELAGQLQYALDYRVVIERGVGFLMARDRLDAVAAFSQLRRAARNSQSRIGEVAGSLLQTGRLPTDPR